jgi:drug/metabolite transporter (DMT)-like permease
MPLIARSERLGPLQIAAWCSPSPASHGRSRKGFRALRQDRCSGSATASASSPRALGRDNARNPRLGLGQASAEKTLLYQLAVSAVLLLAGALVGTAPLPHRLSPLAWGSLAFQIVIVSFASYLVWFWLIRHYPATRLSSFTMLTPVFGLVLGALLLAEPVTARLLFALATVASGIVLVNRRT